MSKQEFAVKLITYGDLKFWCRDDEQKTDESIVEGFTERGDYSKEVFKLPKGAVVLDVGAHIGGFCIMVKHRRPDYKMFAVEPILQNIHMLNMNAVENKTTINVFPYALNDCKGVYKIWPHKYNYGANTMIKDEVDKYPDEFFDSVDVQCVTFDDLFDAMGEEVIDFCKMDIQGAEYPVFRWLMSHPETFKRVKRFELELHSLQDDYETAYNLMEDLQELGVWGWQFSPNKIYICQEEISG